MPESTCQACDTPRNNCMQTKVDATKLANGIVKFCEEYIITCVK